MPRSHIRVGINRDSGDPEAPRGGNDPAGDLSAIGDQDFSEHRALESVGQDCPEVDGPVEPDQDVESAGRPDLARCRDK
jgi:hypothetical protein